MMYVRGFRARAGSRVGALALGAALLVAAGGFLAFGFILVVALTVIGLLLGIAAALYRRLLGPSPATLDRAASRSGLDPALEVSPPPPTRRSPADLSARESLPPT